MRKHKNKIYLTVISIALLGGVALLSSKVAQLPIQPQPPTTSTSAPTKNTSAVGSSKTRHRTATNDESTTPTAATSTPALTTSTRQSTRGALQPLRSAPSAPKQDEIARSITKQYPYRALLSSNDPLLTDAQYSWFYAKTNDTSAWDITTGSQVVVAVIDTGFSLQHEDLSSQWYQNPGETGMTTQGDRCWTGTPQDKATNNCDDDGNGYVDDWRGWNFYGKYTPSSSPCTTAGTYIANNNPQAGSTGDNIYYTEQQTCSGLSLGDPFAAVSHGTSTAGLAGAATNNGKGVASPNWNVKIMPLQALGDDGSGWTSDVVAAIHYAVDNGASIISMSLGGPSLDANLLDAVNYAYAHNVLIVAAAGNCGSGTESGCDPSAPGAMAYPALLDHVLSVGASDVNDARASFSSYGPALDVLAPGSGALTSTYIDRGASSNDPSTFNYTNAYASRLYGTSFSTPIVAGIASLIKSVKPSTSVDDMTAIIDGTARKVTGMNSTFYTTQYGHGVIDAQAMATIAKALSGSADTPKLAQTGDHRSEHSFNTNEQISSGCTVSSSAYCTIRAHNTTTGADRFLPYSLANGTGAIGWSWPGAALTNGEWALHAMQGTNISPDYYLFSK